MEKDLRIINTLDVQSSNAKPSRNLAGELELTTNLQDVKAQEVSEFDTTKP